MFRKYQFMPRQNELDKISSTRAMYLLILTSGYKANKYQVNLTLKPRVEGGEKKKNK